MYPYSLNQVSAALQATQYKYLAAGRIRRTRETKIGLRYSKNAKKANCRKSFMSHLHHFDRRSVTSGLSRIADGLRVGRHVSNVPILFSSSGSGCQAHNRRFPVALQVREHGGQRTVNPIFLALQRPCNGEWLLRAGSGHRSTAEACPSCAMNGSVRPYSMTSSARASKVGGMLRPRAMAVFRLITSSYLTGA